jgi:hypothetical protein
VRSPALKGRESGDYLKMPRLNSPLLNVSALICLHTNKIL